MIKVYFESPIYAELVAIFDNEETYLKCLPSLESLAKERVMIITESIDERELMAELP